MITLKHIYTFLFFIGLFFIPFNEFKGLSFLGEYQNEAATYFFLSGFLVCLADSLLKKRISFPAKHPLILILSAFILWTFLSTLINYPTVSESFFKSTSGVSRYIRQTISLLISAVCFTFLFWNVIKDYSLQDIVLKIRKVLLYSFIFVAVYGFIEIGIVYFGMGFLKPVLDAFEYFPFVTTDLNTGERIGISSVTFEIPALGNYLIFVTPWLVSYIFTHKSLLRFVPTLISVILMLFSDARAAFVVILLQLICLVVILLLDERYRKNTLAGIKIFSFVAVLAIALNTETIYKSVNEKLDKLNFSKNLTKNVSNQSRFGMQYAALQVFQENPVCGVGFGQGTYHMMHHYPYWSTSKNWEFELMYKNQKEKSFPPQYNMYTRLLAEVGIIGFLLFISLLILSIIFSFSYWKKSNPDTRYIYVVLLISLIGFSVNWLQSDFFRHYGFWLVLVLLIKALIDLNSKKINLQE